METINSHIFLVVLILAFLLDFIIGDPSYLPHPVRITGKGIVALEYLLRKSVSTKEQERLAGILLATIVILSTFILAYITEKWVLSAHRVYTGSSALHFLSISRQQPL
jgi:adenosylcobinamide-phosphate synthase